MRQRNTPEQKQQPKLSQVKPVPIAGLEDFPLNIVGLSIESIERSNGHIKIPLELLPYLKICKTPVIQRKKKAETQYRYLLKVRASRKKKSESPKKGSQQ